MVINALTRRAGISQTQLPFGDAAGGGDGGGPGRYLTMSISVITRKKHIRLWNWYTTSVEDVATCGAEARSFFGSARSGFYLAISNHTVKIHHYFYLITGYAKYFKREDFVPATVRSLKGRNSLNKYPAPSTLNFIFTWRLESFALSQTVITVLIYYHLSCLGIYVNL